MVLQRDVRTRQALTAWLQRVWYRRQKPPLPLRLASRAYRRLSRSRLQRPAMSEGAVIVVGNLVVGGSGKTPVVAELARTISATGRRVAIISRGYGGKPGALPKRVDQDCEFAQVGDEPIELYRSTGLPVWVCPDRAAALAAALEEGAEVVIADDGLQHCALPRSFEICLFDAAKGLGNGWLLPAGPLRQPISRLESVDLVLRKRGNAASSKDLSAEDLPAGDLPAGLDFELEPGPLRALGPQSRPPPQPPAAIDALAGIADPQPFFDTLQGTGFEIRPCRLADHQAIAPALLARLPGPVVMTAKDAARLDAATIARRDDLFVLSVRAVLPESAVDRVLAHVREFRP